ncbi:uncharacterized protein LOC116015970 [Ipomoea triloba]|uniref:uncharacterized protein LOC116015970 n=1 Tax=Ipomoea triloba TaxID=35885 RepID=UPI00125DB32A|nr:uncharacterized protein LOC116015970 [Ipomoea triloba]
MNEGILEQGMNDTLITLIPKIENPTNASHFRHISLCNVIYKIITKTLTNRIKPILQKLIGPEQSSFVPGRQILDNILVYQEMLHSMRLKQGNSGYMMLKIDLEKTYDRLDWGFIRDTLSDVGFNEKWTKNIMCRVESSTLKILWNGKQLDEIIPSRGIRQGDSISPYIFVLCMERLSHIIKNEMQKGNWKGVRPSRYGPQLCHLFFADDLVFFAKATQNRLGLSRGASTILVGPRVNVLALANRKSSSQRILARRKQEDSLTSQACPQLATWKGIWEAIDRKIRRFIWGGTPQKRKCHLVRWDVVTLPKNQGGLGIRTTKDVNLAIMAKLGWRLMKESESLWAKVLKSKYAHGKHRFEIFNAKKGSSNAWRRINAALPLVHQEMRFMDAAWETLWKIKVPSKMKDFLWLAMHGQVLGNAERKRRGMTGDGRCNICPEREESMEHILRDCKQAKEVWKTMLGHARLNAWSQPSCKQALDCGKYLWGFPC